MLPALSRLPRRLSIPIAVLFAAVLAALLPVSPLRAQDDGDPLAEPPLLQPVQAADGSAIPAIVIHEIHSKPELDTERLEFVELYNGSSEPANLGFWTLGGGIDYTFPNGVVIPARGYLVVAENPSELRARFGVNSIGPFQGNLSLDGEALRLRSASGTLVDEVEYANGFPWPTVGQTPAYSLQLLNPAFDNSLPGAWRSGQPTPGGPNARLLSNAPPFVGSVRHEPAQPRPGQPVTVYAAAQDPEGILSLKLAYQVVRPGEYIRLTDPAYNEGWILVDMATTGQRDDGGNTVFSVQLPGSLQQHRTLIRYRVYATDTTWKRAILPYADDPQPNFAWFVYGSFPQWQASLAGEPPTAFDFAAMQPIPVMQFVARREDVADALFMPDSQLPSGYMGNEYYWRGTFVYGGVVYDHVTFRARGGVFRYATGKTNWRINFNIGHRLQMEDNYGRPYGVPRDKLNLGSVLQQTHRDRRGEQGMFETMSYRLFNLAGVPSPTTDFIHWRVITDAAETVSQARSDFWGLYLAIEQPDERFLDEHGLPDGNLYKIENYQGTLENLGRDGPADGSDLLNFTYIFSRTATSDEWWRTNFDLEGYYSFRSILEFVHNYDVQEGKNYNYYHNPETHRWSILPWDVDLTWYVKMPGTGVEPFLGPVLSRPAFNVEYQNRLRELRDLLLNEEQLFPMLAEEARWIDSPAGGLSMVDADRFLWDNNPIFSTRYVDPGRSEPYKFYASTIERTFAAMVEQMRQYASTRFAWIDATLLTDYADVPYTPALYYDGAAGFAADKLRFVAGAFADPQGARTFSAMEWRIAEITDPNAPVYDAAAPRLYEIEPIWESGILDHFSPVMTPPVGLLKPGHAYRVRVRMRDTSGRWSHWSVPVGFVAGAPQTPIVRDLVFTEIMYHPAPWGNIPEEELEFVELKNLSDKSIALKGLRITGGIDYEFDFDFTLEPYKFLVLARNRDAFEQRYPYVPFDEYSRRLSNAGDTVTLEDPWGRVIAGVSYDDAAPWPEAADGDGYSLSYNPLAGGQNDPQAWAASRAIGGSPGSLEPSAIWINEVQLFPESARAVELYNPGTQPVDVSNWYLSDDEYDPRKVRLPEGSRIPAQGYLVVDAQRLATSSFDGPLTISPESRTELLLTAGRPDGWVGQYQTRAQIPYAETGISYGRVLDGLGRDQMVAQQRPTFGGQNAGPRSGPVVISAFHYFPAAGSSAPLEYVEIANTTGASVPLYAPGNPALTWQVQGIGFGFPAGMELAPFGRLLLVPSGPSDACVVYGGRGLSAVLGPYAQPLSNSGQEIVLVRPVPSDRGVSWALVDAVAYTALPPWPAQAAGQGAALRRANLDAWGGDPANWQITTDLPGAGSATAGPVSLCSFVARPQPGGTAVTWALDAAPASEITGFTLWRSSDINGAGAVKVGATPVPAAQATTLVYTLVDSSAPLPETAYYWLEAERSGGAPLPLGRTATLHPWQSVWLPVVRR